MTSKLYFRFEAASLGLNSHSEAVCSNLFFNRGDQTYNRSFATVPIITRCMAVFADALVIVITWAKSMDTLKASVQLQGFKPQSSIVLFRNGEFVFWCAFSSSLLISCRLGVMYFV